MKRGYASIQRKLLGLMALLVLVVACAGAVASAWVTIAEHRSLAQMRLQHDLQLLHRDLDQLATGLRQAAASVSADKDLALKLISRRGLLDTPDARDMVLDMQSKLTRKLQRLVASKDYSLAAIYDSKDGKQQLLGYAGPEELRVVPPPSLQEDQNPVGEYVPQAPSALIRFSSSTWRPSSPLKNAPPLHLPAPEDESPRWESLQGRLAVEVRAPVFASLTDPQTQEMHEELVGVVLLRKVVDKDYLEALMHSTGAAFDIFLPDGALAVGQHGQNLGKQRQRFSTVSFNGSKDFRLLTEYLHQGRQVALTAAYLPRDPMIRNIRNIILFQLGCLLLGLLLALTMATLLGRSMIRPLVDIAKEMKDIASSKRFHRRVSSRSGDEIGMLAATFNDMMAELDDTYSALSQAEEKYRGIFENCVEGIFQTTPEGRVVMANPAAAAMLGYDSPEEVIQQVSNLGRELYVSPEDRRLLLEQLSELKIVEGLETWLRRKDGSAVLVSINARPVTDNQGRLALIEGSLLDISERRAREQAEKQRERAEAATQAKSEFLAHMSHEIRTPLNAVIGLTDLTLKTSLTPKQFDYLTKVSSAARVLLGIINDIIDFSKIEARKLEIEHVEFTLEEVLGNVSDLVGLHAEKKELELLFQVDPATPRRLVGDSLRLAQVLMNLGSNAVKFTDSGAVVVGVRPAASTLPGPENEVELLFFVKDTGIGMNQAQMELLFNPFQQADSSTTRKYGGAGLGLSICKSLVEMMGGSIWAESAPGLGSTFFFTARLGLAQDSKTLSALELPVKGLRVLLVDDNATARRILREALMSLSFEVFEAGSGAEALEMLKTTSVDLVLMDWKMPGMDGIEATRQIKGNTSLEIIPAVLMITAYGREETRKRAEEAGVDGFLLKPTTPSLLAESIAQIMGLESRALALEAAGQREDASAFRAIQGARVLVVEDNELNQQVALEHLQQAGLQVSVAVNGREAVAMTRDTNYDLVLMDIQMPEMDGYEATRAIRRRERHEGRKPIPISAMTAHALTKERERCLEAGMDDYLPKPIDPKQLREMLLRLIKPGDRLPAAPAGPSSQEAGLQAVLPGNLPGIDLDKALKLLEKPSLFVFLLLKFAHEYAEVGQAIANDLDSGDLETAHRRAHTIKGLAANLGAEILRNATVPLEEALERRHAQQAQELLPEFETALQEVVAAASMCSLDSSCAEPATAAQHAPPAAQPGAAQKRLLGMVERSELEALEYFQEHKQALAASPLGPRLEELEALLKEYELDQAHALIQTLLEEGNA